MEQALAAFGLLTFAACRSIPGRWTACQNIPRTAVVTNATTTHEPRHMATSQNPRAAPRVASLTIAT
jgi:hypothetical protein